MYEVGKRATAAIEAKAKREGRRTEREYERLGISKQVFSNWKKGKVIPSGYFLRQMAMGGYDVNYILTGVEK